MLLRCYISLWICLFAGFFSHGQTSRQTYQKLVKRYGDVTAWGKGYIVKANGFYGFCDTSGRFVWPVDNFKFDTLLDNRACVAGRATCLVDEYGKTLKTRGFSYVPLNRKRRLIAEYWGAESGQICNENGELLGAQFDPRLPEDSWIIQRKQMGKHSFDFLEGIITRNGDTILPQVYTRIEMGPHVAACMKVDTVFIYDYSGKLLSSFAKVNSCRVLSNNLLLLEKYRAMALANPDGRLLTPFHYFHVDDQGYSAFSQPEDTEEKNGEKEPLSHLAYVRVYSPYPSSVLLDTAVKIVPGYNNTTTNKNRSGSYDMLLKTIVTHPPKKKAAKAEKAPPPSSSEYDFVRKKQELVGKRRGDTLMINVASSMALRRNSRWGIVSLSGDTILPFVYDSIYYYGYDYGNYNYSHSFVACLRGKFAMLDWEGRAATPAVFDQIPTMGINLFPEDSIAITGMPVPGIFSYKGGRLQPVDLKKDPSLLPVSGDTFKKGIAYFNGGLGHTPGLYNRRMQLLSRFPVNYRSDDIGSISKTGMALVGDSLRHYITVIDSSGKEMIPRFPAEDGWITLHEHYAEVKNKYEDRTLLYRFRKEGTRLDTVWWDQRSRGAFTIRGYKGIGIYGFDTIVTIPEAEEVIFDGNLVRFRINKKWGMCTKTGELLLPSNYDEPPAPTGNFNQFNWRQVLIRQHGRVGVYDFLVGKWVTPDHDSIYYYYDQSYTHFYIITQSKNGTYWFVNDDGQRMTARGWELTKTHKIHQNMYPGALCGFPVSRNGRSYRLYPTLGDSLEIVPDLGAITGQVVWISREGIAIVQKDSLLGLYSTVKNVWLVPPVHKRLERDWESGRFFVYTVQPPGIRFFDPAGNHLFTMNGTYSKVRKAIGDQWYLNDGLPPVINSSGRIIVPDTFTRFRYGTQEERTPLRGFYKMQTKDERWMFIDTSGKVILPPIANKPDYFYTDQGNFIFPIDDKYGLVNRKGELLLYNKITECKAATISTASGSATLHTRKYDNRAKEICFVVSEGTPEKFGLLDREGNTLIPCMYDWIHPVLIDTTVLVKKGNRWGLVSLKNKPVKGFIYDTVKIEEEGQYHLKGL